jgi:hypothetical protein
LAVTGVFCLMAAAGVWLLGSGGEAVDTTEIVPPAAQGRPTSAQIIDHPALSMPRSAPVRIVMPSVGVRSRLMRLGLQPDGTLEVPPGAYPAGWFTGAPTPGEVGPAVIVGHVSYNGTDGVFVNLARTPAGGTIAITRADDSKAIFRVTRVAHFAKAHFPSKQVYGNLDFAGLRLITCGGFNPATDSYADNVVVFASLARIVAAP